MIYQSENTALAWSDAKSAALYFDRVVPVNLADLAYTDKDDPIYYKVLQKLLPDSLLDSTVLTGLTEAVINYVANYYITFPAAMGVTELADGQTLEDRRRERLPEMIGAFSELVQKSGVRDFAVYGEELTPTNNVADASPCLILSELSLIDTARLSWRHLLEFREDADSVKKLRRLRRFVYEQYDGKPLSFIKDDLEGRIEKYNEATRFWGFPLASGLLEICLTGEAAAALGGVLGLALFGAPLVAAAAVGGTITLGKAALSVARRKKEINLKGEEDPVAYIAAVRALTD